MNSKSDVQYTSNMLHKNNHNEPGKKDATWDNLVPGVISECSLSATNGEVCSNKEVISAVRDNIGLPHTVSDQQTIAEAKKATRCNTERCAVERLGDKIVAVIGRAEFTGNLANNFKVDGPLDTTWLSNVHIDSVLKQWEVAYPTVFMYNFNMRNYMDWSFTADNQLVNQPDTLATVHFDALYRAGKTCAACIVNNDKYQGGGTHWMAIFVDARTPGKATCEFFNSAGNNPVPEFVSYLVRTAREIENMKVDAKGKPCTWRADIKRITRRRHQQSTTECGLYSLFYVWARINGVSWQYFLDNPIDDQLMFEFRHHLFASDMVGKKFDWNEFRSKVKVEWE